MITPIVMSLRAYLDERDTYACCACGTVAEPAPRTVGDCHGQERRCTACMQESALPLHVAAGEGWLRVLDQSGRLLNDNVRQVAAGGR